MIGVIASQPTKESISTVAARPIDSGPCGAKGVQFARASGRPTRQPRRPRPAPRARRPGRVAGAEEARPPLNVTASTASNRPAANIVATPRPPPATTRCSRRPPRTRPARRAPRRRGSSTRRPAGSLAETGADIRGDPATIAQPAPKRREHPGEKAGQEQQAQPVDDGGRARDGGSETRHDEHARPQQGADIQGGGTARGHVPSIARSAGARDCKSVIQGAVYAISCMMLACTVT